MSKIDINQTELNIVQQTNDERWKQENPVKLDVVDVEIRMSGYFMGKGRL